MLNKNNINDVLGYVQFKSKGPLKHKPNYFCPGGFGIPVNVGEEKDYIFNFDFTGYVGYANVDEDGIVTIDFSLGNLDWEYVLDSFDCSKDLNLLDILYSIKYTEMDEIYYLWDKKNEDGTITENAEHFFDVTHFQLDVFYKEDDEEKLKQIIIPRNLLDSYNSKTDMYWGAFC